MLRTRFVTLLGWMGGALILVTYTGCSSGRSDDDTIKMTGSDTMVGLAQAWAAAFGQEHPNISMQVKGGGSGVGIAALCSGKIKIATASRPMTEKELELAKKNTGKDPHEIMVGFDALAVYVHKNSPLNEITIEQLGEIYAEGGKITKWSQLGVTMPNGSDEIIRVSRQSNSGTYFYFREAILGEGRDFRLGSRDMQGSKDVVELVANTPSAIGYSGMGYATPAVKALRIARKAGEPAYAPTVEDTLNHTYPIARPLFMYTLGEPAGAVKQYIDWVLSPAGQKIVVESGYVPLPNPGGSKDAGK